MPWMLQHCKTETINPKCVWSIPLMCRFHSALCPDLHKVCRARAHRCMWAVCEHSREDTKNLEYSVILSSAGTDNVNLFKFNQLWLWIKDLQDNSQVSGFYPIMHLKPIVIIILETQKSNIINSPHLWCFHWDQMHDSLLVMTTEDIKHWLFSFCLFRNGPLFNSTK